MLEEAGDQAAVRRRLPWIFSQPERLRPRGNRGPVRRVAGDGDLAPHVPVAVLHIPPDLVLDLVEVTSRGVSIQGDSAAALSPEELVHRHTGFLTFYVPQRHV